jgi:histidyl-tRNA synthetase
MALSTQPYKGARDFYPEDKRLQNYMFSSIRHTVERFGYEEYDAPILESLDLYLAKSGEEIVNQQTYSFTDRGGRQVVIRPEMTPTVSRMVAARRQELAYPLRWYSIPNLWRYERPQRGRLREHWQLNVDVFGIADSQAEFEIIQLADQIFKDFGASADMYQIKLNSRLLINAALSDYLGLDESESHAIAKLIDRMHKLDRQSFISQADQSISAAKREAGVIEKLLGILDTTALQELPTALQSLEATIELMTLINELQAAGLSNVVFDITIMRGFDYYTDVVFEINDTHPDNNRSMMGGGRYDGLVGLFGVAPVPTVGFGLGDATLANFLDLHALVPPLPPETKLFVALIGDVLNEAQPLLAALRSHGIDVAVGVIGRKLADQFKVAEKKAIQHVLIIGDTELQAKNYQLKDLQTGLQQTLSLEQLLAQFA